MAGNNEVTRILGEIRGILDRSARDAAEDRKQAAEDRKQADRDRAKWEEMWARSDRQAAQDRREAAHDRREAAHERKQADRDRREFRQALLVVARVGRRIEDRLRDMQSTLSQHTGLLKEIRSILKLGGDGHAHGNS